MSRKSLAVDSDMIDQALDELSKLILRLDKNPEKTKEEQNTIKKFKRFGIRYRIRFSMRN